MHNIDWQTPLSVTSFCLIPVLLLSILIAWRTRSIQTGLHLFLLFFVLVIAVIFIGGILSQVLSDSILRILFVLLYTGSLIFILGSGLIYLLNIRRAGKPLFNSTNPYSAMHTIAGILFLAVALTGFISLQEISGNTAVTMLLAGTYLGKIFLASQVREQGIVSRGKFIRFGEIQSMQWADLRNKGELHLILKNSNRTYKLKIPWEIILPFGDYMKKNFPCT